MFLFIRHYTALIISQMLMILHWPKSNCLSVLGSIMCGSAPSLWKWLANCYLHVYLLMLHTAQLIYCSLRTSPSVREIPRSYAHWLTVLPSLNVSAGTCFLWCTPSLLIILCTLMTPTVKTSAPTSPLNSRLLYPTASLTFPFRYSVDISNFLRWKPNFVSTHLFQHSSTIPVVQTKNFRIIL